MTTRKKRRRMKLLALDTYYFDTYAKTVGIEFSSWDDSEPYRTYVDYYFDTRSDYVPGEFYKRELPCILSLLKRFQLDPKNYDFILIDGYVYLYEDHIPTIKSGLGAHLYQEIHSSTPIIGIAKSVHGTSDDYCKKIYRGKSKAPLYITSVGLPASIASKYVLSMHGKFRIPTILKKLDKLTKTLVKMNKELILKDGVIDAEETAAIKAELLADGKIDRDEANDLFELKDKAEELCDDFRKFFVEAIVAHIMEDGKVDEEEIAWFKEKAGADGEIDEMEQEIADKCGIQF